MAFLIEIILVKFLAYLIDKLIGWKEDGYNELIHSKQQFIFHSYSKAYAFLKYVVLALLCGIVFLYIFAYFYGLYHGYEYVPSFHDNQVWYSETYQDRMAHDSWVMLLSAFAIYLDITATFNYAVQNKKKTTLIEWKNLNSSFRTPFWSVLMLGCFLRVILLLFLEDGNTIMNIDYLSQNIILHPNSYSISLCLCSAYYLICIFATSIFLICFIMFFLHPHIKSIYLSQYVNMNSFAEKILRKYQTKYETKKSVTAINNI